MAASRAGQACRAIARTEGPNPTGKKRSGAGRQTHAAMRTTKPSIADIEGGDVDTDRVAPQGKRRIASKARRTVLAFD